ncbi:Kinesin-1 [Tetrabaena socialis]|uniref:Kinesin-like protein n=1 Tax=Tetrabaena socialis TaxID=47790 RepID=A0A2J8A9D4_9CHLO|nr:Kinesin-1 [Tetrabaena socialis]|eukprot:PNH09093.1 Kinesin-1 [Tetrabaena socialis]
MDDRRESRIPRPGVGGGAGATTKPLEPSKATNSAAPTGSAMDRKRKADAVSDAVPDAKRPTFSAGQGARPTRSNTTTGAGGRSASVQQATSARTGPSQAQGASELGPIAEESWDDIRDKTGQAPEDVLSKKVAFAKGTKPERKVEAFVPLVKELKALGRHLHGSNQRLELDVEQWKRHSAELSSQAEAERHEWTAKQAEVAKQMQEIRELLELQEQQNNKLESDIKQGAEQLAEKEAARATLQQRLDGVEADLERASKQLEERDGKVKEMEELIRTGQKYSTTLQTYNTSLQADLTAEKTRRDEVQRAKDELQGQAAELGGRVRSLEQLLAYEREQVEKLRNERESATRDIAMLRADLDNTRQERERAVADMTKAKDDLDRLRTAGGKSMETLEALSNDKATMEAQLSMQQRHISSMREELAGAKENRAMSDALADTRASQITELKAQVESLQGSLADAERRVYEGELVRRKLHNIIQDLKGNIRVYCRVRPVSSSEASDSAHDSEMSLDFPAAGDLLGRGLTVTVNGNLSGQAPQKHSFAFDRVFSPGTTQDMVFDELSELVQSALDGHKVCIFAYGQTGSGKTFTMLGSREQPGVIPRAMQQIFTSGQKLAAQDWQFNMQASMLEIYNEEIRDLLSRRKDDSKKHQVTHDSNGLTTVSDLTLVDVNRPEAVDQLLAQAMDKRAVGCTALNEQSSRSHMVFSMRIEGHNTSTDAKVCGVLNLIDLAGSERVKESGAIGQRLKEAQAINKSLSALGDVIMALANKQEHVPFRNSKLTYLLQPSLGGDSKTLMFLNVAPTREFGHESLCSLRFGSKVNACEINVPKKNVTVPRG